MSRIGDAAVPAFRSALERRTEDAGEIVPLLEAQGWRPGSGREKTLAAVFGSREAKGYQPLEELKSPDAATMIELVEQRIQAPMVIRALGRLGDAGAVEVLRSCVADAELRTVAVGALGAIDHVRSATVLAGLAGDDDPEMRTAACRALGHQSSDAACDALRGAVLDPVPAVRIAAIESLGRMGRGDAAPLILEQATAGDERIRWAAAWALHAMQASEAGRVLDDLLAGASPALRDEMADTLVQWNDPRGVAMLADRVSRQETGAALRTLDLLERIGDERAVGPLVRVARGGQIAWSAVQTLTAIVARSADRVGVTELDELAALSGVIQPGDPDPDAPYSSQQPQEVDCSMLNAAARAELARRGGI